MAVYFDEFFVREYRLKSKGAGKKRYEEIVRPKNPTAWRDYKQALLERDAVNYALYEINELYQELYQCAVNGWYGDYLPQAISEFKHEVGKLKKEHGVPNRIVRPYYELDAGTIAMNYIDPIIYRQN